MRSAAFLSLSCAVHGAAVTAALGLSAYTGSRVAAAPPLVEVQHSEPSAPSAAAAIELPDVVVEAVVEPVPIDPREVVESEPELAPAPSEREPLPAVRPPLLARIAAPATPPPAAAQAAASAAAPQPWVEAVERADNEPPCYPEGERLAGHEGVVVVTATIDATGAVLDVALRQPARWPALNREALRVVGTWRFEPARLHGAPVATTRNVAVEFRLVDAPARR